MADSEDDYGGNPFGGQEDGGQSPVPDNYNYTNNAYDTEDPYNEVLTDEAQGDDYGDADGGFAVGYSDDDRNIAENPDLVYADGGLDVDGDLADENQDITENPDLVYYNDDTDQPQDDPVEEINDQADLDYSEALEPQQYDDVAEYSEEIEQDAQSDVYREVDIPVQSGELPADSEADVVNDGTSNATDTEDLAAVDRDKEIDIAAESDEQNDVGDDDGDVQPAVAHYERRDKTGGNARMKKGAQRLATPQVREVAVDCPTTPGTAGSTGDTRRKSVDPTAFGLNKNTAAIEMKPQPVKMRELYRYAERKDKIMLLIGIIFAMMHGVCYPVALLLYKEILNILIDSYAVTEYRRGIAKYCGKICESVIELNLGECTTSWSDRCDVINRTATLCEEGDPPDRLHDFITNNSLDCKPMPNETLPGVLPYAGGMLGIGAVTIIVAAVHIGLFIMVGERQVYRIRHELFRAILRKHIGWFDVRDSRQLNSKLFDQPNKLLDGMCEKLSSSFQMFTTFVAGFAIAFSVDPALAGVVTAMVPVLIASAIVFTRMMKKFMSLQSESYSKAGSVALQALGNIRTVTAFGRQEYETDRYSNNLADAQRMGIRRSLSFGIGQGAVWLCLQAMQILAIWFGLNMAGAEGGDTTVVLLGIMVGAMQFGQMAPNLEIFAAAQEAGADIFQIIDSPTRLDNFDQRGANLASVNGWLHFNAIRFSYPARPDDEVLKGLSFDALPGQTVALVGSAGSGKSTIVQLLLRFYDATGGNIELDGHDIKKFNVSWLREQIGYVGQEPVLFSGSIGDNIRMGKSSATQSDVEAAAKLSNAHDFISKLPEGYDTFVGDRGAQLSGGQKQRIAIARGIIGNPKILLLDEATSALDTKSERVVQEALENASRGRTSIVIAHRLSTIVHANLIIVMKKGEIVESGTHDQLMAVGPGGVYYALATAQQLKDQALKATPNGDEEDEEDDEAVLKRIRASSISRPRTSSNPARQRGSVKRQSGLTGSVKRQSGLTLAVPSVSASVEGREHATSVASMGADIDEDGIDDDEKAEQLSKMPRGTVFRWNSSEWPFMVIGAVGAIAGGLVFPGTAIVISRMLGLFATRDANGITPNFTLPNITLPDVSNFTTTEVDIAGDSQELALKQLGLGLTLAISVALQFTFFGISGEKLTARLRKMCFGAMMRQEIGWFDRKDNQPGILATQLQLDTADAAISAGSALGVMLNLLSNLGVSFIYALTVSWAVALASFAILPVLVVSNTISIRFTMGIAKRTSGKLKGAAQKTTEAIANMRTVLALGQQRQFLQIFDSAFGDILQKAKRRAAVQAMAQAIAAGFIFFAWALCFSIGSHLIDTDPTGGDNINFIMVWRIFNMATIGGLAASRMTAYLGDLGKSRVAALRIFNLLIRQPKIDPNNPDGAKPAEFRGKIEFRNVKFRYPTRAHTPILRGLTFTVEPGQSVALVGTSGCGKSTALQLLQRFYDPDDGDILVDGRPLMSLNISELRRRMAVVQQEPALNDGTIWENIAYGALDSEFQLNGSGAGNTQLGGIEAGSVELDAKSIIRRRVRRSLAFVEHLHEGLDTAVGDRGGHISGGQKQRVAVARALARNPKVLLCDEATSALDAENEKLVQQDIDDARDGRTCLIVAHRLATIQNVDKIIVIDKGRVAEMGTHQQLLERRGLYYSLFMEQQI